MAGYRIRADKTAVLIELTDVGVKKEQFLETIRKVTTKAPITYRRTPEDPRGY
jgi:hypothetical protein